MFTNTDHIRNDVHVVAINWFVNRCPLATRVPRIPVGSTTFPMGRKPDSVNQFCQTFQHPVIVPTNYHPWPETPPRPFDPAKMDALQNLMDDIEFSSYYGKGEDPALMGRPKQKGLRTLITTNRITEPENATAYKPTDLIRDTVERCRRGGGDPDVLLVSTNFLMGFATWGHAVQRVSAGINVFSVPIDVYEAPFLGGVSIIEAPLLKPFTAICLTSSEVRMRSKRNEFWSPRGSRRDNLEGDWIAEVAIDPINPDHHAWVEGVVAFAAP